MREVSSAWTARQRETVGHHLENLFEVQDRMTTVEIKRDLVNSQLQDATEGEDGLAAVRRQRDIFLHQLE